MIAGQQPLDPFDDSGDERRRLGLDGSVELLSDPDGVALPAMARRVAARSSPGISTAVTTSPRQAIAATPSDVSNRANSFTFRA